MTPVLLPVKATATSISAKRGHYNDNDCFVENIVDRIRQLLKSTSCAFNPLGGRFTCHSIRSGGDTSLFVPGVYLGDIRRLGRWKSVTSYGYLRLVDLQYRHLSDTMVNSASLTDQHRSASDKTEGVKSTEPIYIGNGDLSGRTVGRQVPPEMRWRSPCISPEPSDGDVYTSKDERPLCDDQAISRMTVAQHHLGAIALEYLKRSTHEGHGPRDFTPKRSASQEKKSDSNFEAWSERFSERKNLPDRHPMYKQRPGGKGNIHTNNRELRMYRGRGKAGMDNRRSNRRPSTHEEASSSNRMRKPPMEGSALAIRGLPVERKGSTSVVTRDVRSPSGNRKQSSDRQSLITQPRKCSSRNESNSSIAKGSRQSYVACNRKHREAQVGHGKY